ncbi:MAG: family 10 glycosylhydrolase [bacterium]|nr:family 10 glycosylhydrolase [bacterium]
MGALLTVLIGWLVIAPSSAATVVVDNADPGFAVLSGAAWGSRVAPGQWATDYIGQNTSDPPGVFEWRPDLPAADQYEVAVWIPATGDDRPDNAHYIICHAGGVDDAYVNQATAEVQWVVLGTFAFAAGTTGRVTLDSSAQADTDIVADAVRFTTGPQTAPEFRAFWASTAHEGLHSLDEIDDMVSRAMQGNYNVINALILARHDTAASLYGALWNSSIVPKAPAYPPEIDPLAHLIQRAHANGLKVHGRLLPYWLCDTWPPVGNAFLSSHPEWLCVPIANMGAGPAATIPRHYWLDPGSPDVQEYLISIVRELVTNYEIDGIHWDFIRHASQDAGYPADNSYSGSGLARFHAMTGRSDTPPPTGDALWNDFRRRTIDELVRRSRAEIAAIKSNPAQPLSLTAAVAGWGAVPVNFEDSSAYRGVFQNWEKWMRMGWLDGTCPMIYLREHVGTEHDRYRGWVDAALGWRYDRHTYIGQCLYKNSMANSVIQMQYAYDQGADGTINFAYGATADNNLDGIWEADWSWYPHVSTNLFTEPASTPDMPWRGISASEGTLWGQVTDGITDDPIDDATVSVAGIPPVQTDANGYYVVTMIPAAAAGTNYAVTAEHPGYVSAFEQAAVLAGDVARLDIAFDTPLLPIIAEVTPDPAELLVGQEYLRQLSLEQGTAQPWTLVAGPPEATVSAKGWVSGWVPSESQDGQLIDFTVRAENSAGSDEESWQVLVAIPPPCEPLTITDFEGYASGTRVLFQYPRYSGSTDEDLESEPNVAEVTDEVAAFSGASCYKVQWQLIDTEPHRWMRLTTHNGAYVPNPTVRLDHRIRVRLRVDAGRFRLAVGIRETETTADVGDDGGTAGTIEWIGAASDIDGAPQGVLVEPMPGVWQTFIFDPLTDPIHGFSGDGTLSTTTNKGVFEHLAFAVVDTVGPFTVYVDDVELLCDSPLPADIILESRDALGDLTPPPTYTEDGAWANSSIKSAAPGMTGTGSRFITYDVPNAGTDNATFLPTVEVAGLYGVFVTWANGANCYDAKYTVRHHHGDTVQLVDQISGGAPEPANYDEWIPLGEYWLAAGQSVDSASVNVSEETVSGRPSTVWNLRVYADGLRLEFVEPWPDGDYTGEGNVDLGDYAYWLDCMVGPTVGYDAPRCHVFDSDLDNDVDLADFVEFLRVFDGLEP